MNLKMVGHVGRSSKLSRREDMERDTSFNHFKKTTNYQLKTLSFLVILFLFIQSVTVQGKVLNVSHSNILEHLAPGSEDKTTIQEGILGEETGSRENRSDEVSQVLADGKLEDVIAAFVVNITTSKYTPLKINNNVLHRKERDISPFSARATCVLTDEELDELLEVLQDEKPTFRGTKPRAGNGTSTKEHCSQVVEIKNEILNLKQTFQKLTSYQTTVVRYEELKLSYEEEVQTLERKIDDITRNANQEMSRKVAKFVSDYQLVLKEMNRLLAEVEKTQKLYYQSQIRVCILEIKNKEFKFAAQTCSSLLTPKLLEIIFKSVYANNVANVQVILGFLNALPPTVQQNVIACSSIYDEMMTNNHLQSTEIMMLDNLISETLRMPPIKNTAKHNFTDTLTGLKHAIESPVRYIIATWSVKIGNGNYGEIHALFESPFINSREYLSLLIQLSYNSDSRNTEHVLGFVKGFTSLTQSGIIYETLFNEMHEIDEMYGELILQFAFQVKEVMDSFVFRSSSYEDRNRFTSIKKRLPLTVRLVFWHQVCIKNVYFSEYIQFNGYSSVLVSSIDKLRPVSSVEGVWRFKPTNEGKSFHICNTKRMRCWSVTKEEVTPDTFHINVNPRLETDSGIFESWNITMSRTDRQLYFYPFSVYNALYANNGVSGEVRYAYLKKPNPVGSYDLFELEQC